MTTPPQGHPIGTLCRVDCAASLVNGKTCWVVSEPYYGLVLTVSTGVTAREWVQQVEFCCELKCAPYPDTPRAYQPSELIPIDPKGREKASWDDEHSVWQPDRATA